MHTLFKQVACRGHGWQVRIYLCAPHYTYSSANGGSTAATAARWRACLSSTRRRQRRLSTGTSLNNVSAGGHVSGRAVQPVQCNRVRVEGRVGKKTSPGQAMQYSSVRVAGSAGKKANPEQSRQYRRFRAAGRVAGKEVSPGQPMQSRCVKPPGRAGRQVSFGQPQQDRCIRAAGRAGKDTIPGQSLQDRCVRVAGSAGKAVSPVQLMQNSCVRAAGRAGKEASPGPLMQSRCIRPAGRAGRQVSPGQLQQFKCVRVAGRAGKHVSPGQPLQCNDFRVAGRAGKHVNPGQRQQNRRCNVAGNGGSVAASQMYSVAARFPAASQAAMDSAAVGRMAGLDIYILCVSLDSRNWCSFFSYTYSSASEGSTAATALRWRACCSATLSRQRRLSTGYQLSNANLSGHASGIPVQLPCIRVGGDIIRVQP